MVKPHNHNMSDSQLDELRYVAQIPVVDMEHRARVQSLLSKFSTVKQRFSDAVRIVLTAIYPADAPERRLAALSNYRIVDNVIRKTGCVAPYPIHDAETCRKILETYVEIMSSNAVDLLNLIRYLQLGKKHVLACMTFMDRVFNLLDHGNGEHAHAAELFLLNLFEYGPPVALTPACFSFLNRTKERSTFNALRICQWMVSSSTNVSVDDFLSVRNACVEYGHETIQDFFLVSFAKRFPDAYIDAGAPHREIGSYVMLQHLVRSRPERANEYRALIRHNIVLGITTDKLHTLMEHASVRSIVMEHANTLRSLVLSEAHVLDGNLSHHGLELMYAFVQHEPWFPEIYFVQNRSRHDFDDRRRESGPEETWVYRAYRSLSYFDHRTWNEEEGEVILEKILRALHGRDYDRFLDDPRQATKVFMDKKNVLALYKAREGSAVYKFTRADGDTAIMRRVIDWF